MIHYQSSGNSQHNHKIHEEVKIGWLEVSDHSASAVYVTLLLLNVCIRANFMTILASTKNFYHTESVEPEVVEIRSLHL